MNIPKNSLAELAACLGFVLVYGGLAWKNIQDVSSDVAQGVLTYFYAPFLLAGWFFLGVGLDWYGIAMIALGLLVIGLLGARYSGVIRLSKGVPLFTKVTMGVVAMYPAIALIAFYAFSPWEESSKVILFSLGLIPLIAVLVSVYELRWRNPVTTEKKFDSSE